MTYIFEFFTVMSFLKQNVCMLSKSNMCFHLVIRINQCFHRLFPEIRLLDYKSFALKIQTLS